LAILLAGTVTPFGIENLTHPFVMAAGHPMWRNVREWKPIFVKGRTAFGTVWEFLTVFGIFLGLLVLRLLALLLTHRRKREGLTTERIGFFLFNCALAAVVIAMAVRARRFAPLAMITVAPMIAVQLAWILWAKKFYLPTVVLILILLIPTGILLSKNVVRYWPTNPTFFRESLFERMHLVHNSFPVNVDKFLNANNIGGRALTEWRWEGYLRLHSPQIKHFMGGRAQQVYDVETFKMRTQIITSRRRSDPPRPFPERTFKPLAKYGMHLAIIPQRQHKKFVNTLMTHKDGRWIAIYYDGADNVVLADPKDSQTWELIKKAAEGKLKYPSPEIAALSRAACLTSPGFKAKGKVALPACIRANALKPSMTIYIRMVRLLKNHQVSSDWFISYLESENKRLMKIDIMEYSHGVRILECRRMIAKILINLYRSASRPKDVEKAQALLGRMETEIKETYEKWRR
jgi:hypothetical protein